MSKSRLTEPKKQTEASIHYQVCQYLRIQYPHILWRTDYGAGLHMTKAQAGRQKTLQKGTSWPDLFIAHPVGGRCGLFLELKRDKGELTKADGQEWKNEHVYAQSKVLAHLRGLNYAAWFACGFDEAKELIDNYLSGE